ncbi:glycosyltransferase family 4 protein [Methanolobus sediminis]|uniref:Glycosyltransferase family 4 protein n=1 Tax=Methanolobus sediminis TaxID=3072978 RepID=A0AA51UNA6_9EURY|nr:glycosyltransferase family 4 protein [Methanolobus sediminis]WMW25471.1 glycosyltransferase family 4 protein [Methanolobus sediminis]
MESMRIAMFSWESLHSAKVGGLAPHVTELSEQLAKLGHEVHIFTRSAWYRDYDEINGVHYQRCSFDESGDIIAQMNKMCDAMYSRFIQVSKDFGDFDVIHGHDWHPVNVLNRIKYELGKQYVMTYHSTEWGRNGNVHVNSPTALDVSHREWLGGYDSSQVIITSDNFKKEVQDLYSIPDYKISVIPNGISPGKMEKDVDAGSIKKEYGIHPYSPVILFTGRMHYQKGPDMLVRAIPKVLDGNNWGAHFVFIGEGEMRPYCQNLANDLNIGNSCHFLGYSSDDVLKDWTNACDMTCVPSRNEPFGIVVLESWDATKAVVATDAVNIVDNFQNGILSYRNPESIAWGINYALDGLDSRTPGMGSNGKKLVKTKFSWDTIAKNTVDAYNKIE